MRENFLKTTRFLVPLVIFYFLGRIIVSQWNIVKDHRWKFDFTMGSFSFLFLLCTFFLLVVLFRKIFYYLDVHLSLKKTFKIFYISNLGRYIPGKIWQFVGMYYLLDKENVNRVKAASCVLWSNILITMAGILIGLPTLFIFYYRFNVFSLIVTAFFGLTFLFLMQPRFINYISRPVFRKMNRDFVDISLPFSKIIFLLSFCCIIWVLYGIGFFLLASAVTAIEMRFLPLFMGSFAAAYIVGFAALFAPGGIGVREGALAYLLSFYLPLPVATIISILARIWFTLGEITCLLISFNIRDYSGKKAPAV